MLTRIDLIKYGKLKEIDLHGLSYEDARAVLLHEIYSADADINGLIVVHGYHKGQVLRNFILHTFEHPRVYKKVKVDAGNTLLLIKKEMWF